MTGVIDGDTIDVTNSSGATAQVRIIGIDSPEMDTCGAQPAKDAMAGLVQGKTVRLVLGGDGEDKDKYDRLLRYVDTEATDSGLAMINAGFALARYDSRDGYGRGDREDVYVAADAASPDYTVHRRRAGSHQPPTGTQPAPGRPRTSSGSRPCPGLGSLGPFANCDAARAAGAAPLYVGEPGYSPKLDRDKDGVACE